VIQKNLIRQIAHNLHSFRILAVAVIAILPSCHTFDAKEEPLDEDVTIIRIVPSSVTDTTFVGDTVVTRMPSLRDDNCEHVQLTCLGLDGVPVTWKTSNAAVITGYNTPRDISQFGDYRVTAAGPGEATMSFGAYVSSSQSSYNDPLRIFPFAPGVTYQHKYVVLPSAPNRLDAPDVVVLGVGDSTLIFAEPRVGNTPGLITTGVLVWGPSNSSVASIFNVFNSLANGSGRQPDGHIITRTTDPIVIKGIAQGQVDLVIAYKSAVSSDMEDYNTTQAGQNKTPPGPYLLQRTIRVLVGSSVRIVSNPEGPANDASNALITVTIGSTRQYRLLDVSNATVASVSWQSLNSQIATVTSGGLATCLVAGTATIKGSQVGTSLSATTSLVCGAPVVQPTLTLSASSISMQLGQPASVVATVTNASGTGKVQWVSNDPTIVTVSPTSVDALATGAATNLAGVKAGGPVNVVASYTAGGTTVTKTVAVTVAPASGSAVVAMYLDPIDAEYTPTAGNFYRARLINAQGNEVVASNDGGTIRYASNDTAVILIDSVSGLATARAHTNERTTSITAVYTRNGQTIATAPPSPVRVYPVGTPLHMGAVQLVMQSGDPRRIAIGGTISFEVVVRDQTGIKQTSDSIYAKLEVTSSSSAALSITPAARSSNGTYVFTMHANAFPASSAIPGIPNVVTVKGDMIGAMSTIGMIIVPAGIQNQP
jgi:hypothetical protein